MTEGSGLILKASLLAWALPLYGGLDYDPNEKLKYKEAHATSFCPRCGGSSISEISHKEHNQLKLEIA